MDCDDVEDLAGAYALWALPRDTLAEIESHLSSCAKHPQIFSLRAVALSLTAATAERQPSTALKARLMEAVRESTPRLQVITPKPMWTQLQVWPRALLRPYPIVAVALMVVMGLLAWNLLLQLSDNGPRETLVRTLTNGGVATGRILYVPEGKMMVITVDKLSPLSADKAYQVWAIKAGKPESIGLFSASSAGTAMTVLAVDLSGVETVAITVEPASGSPQPTTEPVLRAKI